MKFFNKALYYISSVAVCAVILGAVATAILLPERKADSTHPSLYTTPAPRDSRLAIAIKDESEIVGLLTVDCYFTQNAVLVNYTFGNRGSLNPPVGSGIKPIEHLKSLLGSGDDFAEVRVIVSNLRDVALFVDNCNGALYTDNSGVSYILMGHNLSAMITAREQPEAVSAAFAALLKKGLEADETPNFEAQLMRLADSSSGDFSYIQWAECRDELQHIAANGSIIAAKRNERREKK